MRNKTGSTPVASSAFVHCLVDNKFHGTPCPKGHTLRLKSTRKCSVCKDVDSARPSARKKRVAYNRSPERLEASRASARKSQRRASGVTDPSGANGSGESCSICGVRLVGAGQSPRSPTYDHDHETGLFRGWLCSKHNRGLGCFDDNPQLLKQAIEYLEKFRQEHPVKLLEPDGPAERPEEKERGLATRSRS